MASIVIKQVAVFADTCILEPVSLSIHPGRPVTFIGETGSGKVCLRRPFSAPYPTDCGLKER